MFKGAVSLRPIFAIPSACVVPPANQGKVPPAGSNSSANKNAVVHIAHVLEPNDCLEKSTVAGYQVSAMTACVYEFSATNPGTLRYRELPVSHEALQRNVLQQIVPGASK